MEAMDSNNYIVALALQPCKDDTEKFKQVLKNLWRILVGRKLFHRAAHHGWVIEGTPQQNPDFSPILPVHVACCLLLPAACCLPERVPPAKTLMSLLVPPPW